MGQCVAAIVYGIPMDPDILQNDDGDWISEPPIPLETGGVCDFRCLGLTLAVQNVPEDGEVDLPEGPLYKIESDLASEVEGAKDDWKEIVKWAKSHKVTLERPCLMLVIIERA